MLCRSPLQVGGSVYGCGQCLHCRINRRRVWAHRLMLESLHHTSSSFVTLTYNEESLPNGATLVPSDLTLWLKRLRDYLQRRGKGRFRYFACGEYGDKNGRPHYHACLFGLSPRDADLALGETWGRGLHHVGSDVVNHFIAQYVGGYITKKLSHLSVVKEKGIEPEFARQSRRPGLGYYSVMDIAQVMLRWPDRFPDVPTSLEYNGKSWPLGPYLRRKVRAFLGRSEKTPQITKAIQAARMQVLHPVSSLVGTSKGLSTLVYEANSQKALIREKKMAIYSKERSL